MKKALIITTIIFSLLTSNVSADETKKEVTLVNCLSAESLWIKNNNKKEVIRLIAYDSSAKDTTEIDNYACDLLKSAKKIEIEYDKATKDNYNRSLVWVYVDGKLLQDELLKKGYGQVNNINDEYNYLEDLCKSEASAVKEHAGIWATGEVKEKYCDSGLIIEEQVKKEEEKKVVKKSLEKETLIEMIFFSSLILLLVVTMHRGTYAKKR